MARAIKGEDNLTHKERLFVFYYLGDSQGNGTDAARRAGYSKPTEQAYENLRKPHIRAAIEARVTGAAMSADEVLARLSEHATADIADLDGLITFDAEGKLTIDLKGAKRRGKSHLIKKLRPTRDGIAVEMVDAQAALVHLGKYHRLWDRDAPADEAEEGLPDDKVAARALKAVNGDDDAPGAPEHPAGDA